MNLTTAIFSPGKTPCCDDQNLISFAAPKTDSMRSFYLLLLLCFSLSITAQKPPAKFGDIPMEDMRMTVYPKDSSAEAVVLVDYGESAISYVQGKGFQLSFERLRRVKILTKEGLKWADFTIPLYHDSDQEEKITSIKVMTYNLEGGKVIETKAKSEAFLKEKYDANLNLTKVTWPNVKEGAIVEISYRVVSDFLFNFQDWQFQETIPTRMSEYRARIPEYFNYEKYMQGYVGLVVNEHETQPGSFTINSTQRSANSGFSATSSTFSSDKIEYQEHRFRWMVVDVPAFKKEPFMTASKDYISKINFELAFTNFSQEFSNPGIKPYMGTWEDINKMYWERVQGLITGSNSLKDQVQEALKGLTTPDQKVSAVMNMVKQNVLWDDTYRTYPEKSPKKTWEEKKGNTAEINLLIACLLEKAEINANPVLLSTLDHGFVREQMPVSSQFNNVVCFVRLGDKSVLLDGTDKFLPVGMLPEACLNGKGFMVGKEGFQWINLQPAIKTRTVFNTDLSLSESGELKGTLKIDKTGYSSVDARKTYFASGEKDYVKTLSNGHSLIVSKSEFPTAKEMQQPFKEIHEIAINEHITEAGNTIYLSPFVLGRTEENPFKQEKRTYPIDFGHPFDQTYMAKILIPEGFTVDELPKGKVIGLPEGAAKYSFSIVQLGNTVSVTSSLNINRGLFTQEEYLNLREFFGQIVAKQAEQIVLKRK